MSRNIAAIDEAFIPLEDFIMVSVFKAKAEPSGTSSVNHAKVNYIRSLLVWLGRNILSITIEDQGIYADQDDCETGTGTGKVKYLRK